MVKYSRNLELPATEPVSWQVSGIRVAPDRREFASRNEYVSGKKCSMQLLWTVITGLLSLAHQKEGESKGESARARREFIIVIARYIDTDGGNVYNATVMNLINLLI